MCNNIFTSALMGAATLAATLLTSCNTDEPMAPGRSTTDISGEIPAGTVHILLSDSTVGTPAVMVFDSHGAIAATSLPGTGLERVRLTRLSETEYTFHVNAGTGLRSAVAFALTDGSRPDIDLDARSCAMDWRPGRGTKLRTAYTTLTCNCDTLQLTNPLTPVEIAYDYTSGMPWLVASLTEGKRQLPTALSFGRDGLQLTDYRDLTEADAIDMACDHAANNADYTEAMELKDGVMARSGNARSTTVTVTAYWPVALTQGATLEVVPSYQTEGPNNTVSRHRPDLKADPLAAKHINAWTSTKIKL